jgi:flagellin-like protein
MKGISPMIAVILLIAFTVAIGGIISIFFTTFTRTQTTTVSGQTEDQVRCLNSVLAIKDVTGDTGTGAKDITAFISYDSGTITLDNITIDVTCGGNTTTNTTIFPNTISPGALVSVWVNTTAAGAPCYGSVDSVRARATCVGPSTGNKYPIVAECKSGAGCGVG